MYPVKLDRISGELKMTTYTVPKRVDILKHKFSNSIGLPFKELLPEATIDEIIRELKIKYRCRLFTPVVTLWAFLSQVLEDVLKVGGYRGEEFARWVIDMFRWIVEIVLRPLEKKGFVHLPKRWVVERTFGWLNWCRRLSKDYEHLPETSETFIYIAMIRIMVRRLA
jgi:transposase